MSKQRTIAEDIAAMRDKLAVFEREARPETNPFINSDNDEQATEAYGLEFIPKYLEKGAELFGKAKPKAVTPTAVTPKTAPAVTPPGKVYTAKPNNPNATAQVPATKPGVISPEEAAKIKAQSGEVGLATAQRRAAADAANQATAKTATTADIAAALKPGAGAVDDAAKLAKPAAGVADDAGKAAAAELKAAGAGGKLTFMKWARANPGKLALATTALGLPAGYFFGGDGQGGKEEEPSPGPGPSPSPAPGPSGDDDSALIAQITALYKDLSGSGVPDIVSALVPIKDKFEGAGGKFATDEKPMDNLRAGTDSPAAASGSDSSAPAASASGDNLGVAQMQKELMAKDPNALPKHGADGKMGPETKAALAKFPDIAAKYGF